MKNEQLRDLINRLVREIEEEDVGISLFTLFSENQDDLRFFKEEDRERAIRIIKTLSEDSRRHKGLLEKIIIHLGRKRHEK